MPRLRLLVLLIALALIAVALTAWAGGGLSIDLAGLSLRVRRPARLGVAGAVLFVAWGTWARRRWRDDARAAVQLPWTSPGVLAGALAVAVFMAGAGFGTFAAGGADPYGYVSEGKLLLEGRLRVPQDADLVAAPWPETLWTLSPLGYRPATVPGAIVPTYPQGLPLLFAAARAAGGECAPFYVVPLAGALLVWLTWRLAARLLPPPLGPGAALVVAVSPSFVFQLMWPMSDVPVAALWLGAILLSADTAGTGRWRPLAAGLVASLAILVRPNLAPLAAVCAAALIVKAEGARRWAEGIRAAALFLAGLLPGVIALAGLNVHLYGAWWRVGYSGTDEFYSLANVLPNLRRYGGWMILANTPAFLLSLAPLVAWRRFLPPHGRWRLLVTGLIAGVWLSYLPYFEFDDWWYLRFLLPAWPALAVLTVAAFHGILARLVPSRASGLALAAILVLAAVTFGRAEDLGAFDLRPAEQRYADAGHYLAGRTPPGSVVLSMQHSGSVRYYGGRTTLRYDLLEPQWLDRTIAYLAGHGRRPYILLEDWEVPAFRARFKGTEAGDLGWNPVAEWRNGKVLLFDAAARASDRSPERMPPATKSCRMRSSER